jgi:hypothetical protein
MIRARWSPVLLWTFSLFVFLWLIFFALYRRFPYLKNGSDLVFRAKLRWEAGGAIFPDDPRFVRVLLFGNSKILAGFVPSLFDRLAATSGLHVSSFNSGFPGSDLVLPPLRAMCARGQAPNVLLLSLPWRADPPRRTLLRFLPDDHAVIEALFPFRNLMMDFTSFLMRAPGNGGLAAYYRAAEQNESRVIAQRGYYLISEQSNFPNGRLPDDFHLASDQPNTIFVRTAPPPGSEAVELNRLISQYRIHCYFVPFYLRLGEVAPAPAYDQRFATAVERATPCKLVGPDYFLYPNQFFSDQTHLNKAGAELYTEALFRLLEDKL